MAGVDGKTGSGGMHRKKEENGRTKYHPMHIKYK